MVYQKLWTPRMETRFWVSFVLIYYKKYKYGSWCYNGGRGNLKLQRQSYSINMEYKKYDAENSTCEK